MPNAKTVRAARERFANLLLSDPVEREKLLARAKISEDEFKALMYRFVRLPSADMNKPPTPPFPDAKLKRLLESAVQKYILYTTIEAVDHGEENGEQPKK